MVKYKTALSKGDYFQDNSYCMRLVIVWLAVNIGKLQSLVREDKFISFLVYKLTCARCSSSGIGETFRHFKTKTK